MTTPPPAGLLCGSASPRLDTRLVGVQISWRRTSHTDAMGHERVWRRSVAWTTSSLATVTAGGGKLVLRGPPPPGGRQPREGAAPVWLHPFLPLGRTRWICLNFNQRGEEPRGGRRACCALLSKFRAPAHHDRGGVGRVRKAWHPALASSPPFLPRFPSPSSLAGRSDFLRARLLFLLPGSRQTFSPDLSLSLSVFFLFPPPPPPSMR